LRAWLAAGKHGSMAYLAEHVEARLDPRLVLPGARSVIMAADFYSARGRGTDELPPGMGRIAKYARGRDYHDAMKRRLKALCDALRGLHPGEAFRAFTDTAPVPEREYAARAGLGWVGKHTLLIHPKLGSYMLLGGVLTTMDLGESAVDAGGSPLGGPDHCGTCTRCIEACPTGAITPYSVDASRCIAYLTIERRRAIGAEFHAAMGDWVFGCDVCQDVCPHNSARPGMERAELRPEYAERRAGFDLLTVLGWDESARRRAFESSALKRATLAMMKRNVLIVIGNLIAAGRATGEMAARVRAVAADEGEPDMVRDAAREALARGR